MANSKLCTRSQGPGIGVLIWLFFCKPALIWPQVPKQQVTVDLESSNKDNTRKDRRPTFGFGLAEMTLLKEHNLQRNFINPKLLSTDFCSCKLSIFSVTQSKCISSFFLFSATIVFRWYLPKVSMGVAHCAGHDPGKSESIFANENLPPPSGQ